jgi:sugar fermentation stimulation protein A
VKSCTLVERSRALFPDAPTIRGTRHVKNLMLAREQGFRACVLFLVQRSDADVLSPNDGTDPSFGESLRRAAERGVDILAYGSRFTDDHVILTEGVPVDLRKERDGSEKA